MKRYLSSFLLSILIYISGFAALMYSMSDEELPLTKKEELVEEKMIRVSLMQMPKKIVQAQPKQTQHAKIKPKKILLSKPQTQTQKVHKPKPIVKKQIERKQAPTQETKPVQEIVKEKTTEPEVIQDVIVEAPKPQLPTEEELEALRMKQLLAEQKLKARQQEFFLKLRHLINQNKTYPKSARRRGIEGDVEVSFSLLASGRVDDIRFLSGRSIFERSTLHAIEESFPVKVEDDLFAYPKEFTITLAYILK